MMAPQARNPPVPIQPLVNGNRLVDVMDTDQVVINNFFVQVEDAEAL